MVFHNHKYLMGLYVMFIMVGCRPDSEPAILPKNVHQFSLEQSLNSNSTALDINQYFNLTRAIILEFKDSMPIHNIFKVLISAPSIFILDNVQNFIFVYDLQGRFLHRIGEIGDGPGEYLDITDFVISNNEVIIFSNSSRKIIHYTSTGSLVKEIPIIHFGEAIVLFNDGYILHTKNNVHPQMPYDLLLLNSAGEMVDRAQKVNPGHPVFQSSGFLLKNELDNIRYMKTFGSTIYSINEDFKLVPLYSIDLGSSALDVNKFTQPDELMMHYHEYTHMTNYFWENESVTLFYYFHDLKMRFGLIPDRGRILMTSNQFHDDAAIDVLRSIQSAAMYDDKLLVCTHPGFNNSEYNFDLIDSLVQWNPEIDSESDKKSTIENSNGVIFEMEILK